MKLAPPGNILRGRQPPVPPLPPPLTIVHDDVALVRTACLRHEGKLRELTKIDYSNRAACLVCAIKSRWRSLGLIPAATAAARMVSPLFVSTPMACPSRQGPGAPASKA